MGSSQCSMSSIFSIFRKLHHSSRERKTHFSKEGKHLYWKITLDFLLNFKTLVQITCNPIKYIISKFRDLLMVTYKLIKRFNYQFTQIFKFVCEFSDCVMVWQYFYTILNFFSMFTIDFFIIIFFCQKMC